MEFPNAADMLQRAITGDRDAYAQLCETQRERVWRIALGMACGADAEDIAQEAIIRGWRSIRDCAGPNEFPAWIARITINAARDHHRSAWKRRVLLLASPRDRSPETGPDTAHLALERQQRLRVRRAVSALPAKMAGPIWMHYFEQFTVADIAVIEKTAESTIRSRMKVGLDRLQHSLADLVVEEMLEPELKPVAGGARP